MDKLKEAATLYNTNRDGSKHVKGHQAIDPSGHLMVLPPGHNLPDKGWRWATAGDVERAAAVEKARAEKEAASAKAAAAKAKAEQDAKDALATGGGPLKA